MKNEKTRTMIAILMALLLANNLAFSLIMVGGPSPSIVCEGIVLENIIDDETFVIACANTYNGTNNAFYFKLSSAPYTTTSSE